MEEGMVLGTKNKSFGTRSTAENREIVQGGRPNPALKFKDGMDCMRNTVHYVMSPTDAVDLESTLNALWANSTFVCSGTINF